MLQRLDSQEHIWQPDRGYLFRPAYYLDLLKRRLFYFLVPFVIVCAAGLGVAAIWPATYLSQGKILVQSQQIPIELVRPTVTTLANERIQVIQQRVLTRDNLLDIVNKFHLFPDQKSLMQPTQLVELMRTSAKIEPVMLTGQRTDAAIAFTVGFEYQEALTASKVANELVTRFLDEDLRDRTTRATDTTKFLARDAQRWQAESKAIDLKIEEFKRNHPAAASDQNAAQMAQLRSDLAQKSAVYSDRHPVVQALKRQVEAFAKVIAQSADVAPDAQGGLNALEEQQEGLRKSLEVAVQRLSAARLGETLERDQQSEKLEVIEQPTVPQDPIRPNRSKIVRIAIVLALVAGGAVMLAAELLDNTLRRTSDIFSVVESQMVISIPYISTKAELLRNKTRTLRLVGIVGVFVLCVAALVLYFSSPLDLIIARARVGLFR
jgi:uncharacterized protein involved in exopolysaccharide biosynthesis